MNLDRPLVGRKVRGVVACLECGTPEEATMCGYFLIAGQCEPGLSCERCGRELEANASTAKDQGC